MDALCVYTCMDGRVNVIGTLNIADCCNSRGIHCTIFATGCIYEYDAEHQIGQPLPLPLPLPPAYLAPHMYLSSSMFHVWSQILAGSQTLVFVSS
jgi:hypothetical protein